MNELFMGIIYISESNDRAVVNDMRGDQVLAWMLDRGFEMWMEKVVFTEMFPYVCEDDEDIKHEVEKEQ